MDNTDIETFVTLKFCPPKNTIEYIESIPERVRIEVAVATYKLSLDDNVPFDENSITLEKFEKMYRNTFEWEFAPAEQIWDFMKPYLIKYYEEHSH